MEGFRFFVLCYLFWWKVSLGQITCTSVEDCSESEFCAIGDICTTYNCEGLYEVIDDQIDGIQELVCKEYEGQAEGQIFACSVEAGVSNSRPALAIDPLPTNGQGVVIQEFSRECIAAIPPQEGEEVGSQFYCLDTVGADFEKYLASVANSTLDCQGEKPVHSTTRFDLLTGLRASVVANEEFNIAVANSGFYAAITATAPSTTNGELDSGSRPRAMKSPQVRNLVMIAVAVVYFSL